MIKAIIFDLDGVLVDTRAIHFNSLNKALKKYENYIIPLEDHLRIYDGLPTKKKLEILIKKKKLKKTSMGGGNFDKIINEKKAQTNKLLNKKIKFSFKIYNLFKKLNNKFKIVIATNAVKSTLETCIKKLRIAKFVDLKICNENVTYPKPHPQIYLKCLVHLGIKPKESLILEDSFYGRESVQAAGCHLYGIKKLTEVKLKNILNKVSNINNGERKESCCWVDNKLNILIPMAGLGSRFSKTGYTLPKPLIEVKKKPMIQLVIESLNLEGNYIFIIQKEHQKKYNLKTILTMLKPDCKIIELNCITEGAACTTLLAKKFINNRDPLVIANADQFIKYDSNKTMHNFTYKNVDGGILTFQAYHPKWSYAKLDKNNNFVIEVAEKKVISKHASVGVYFWKQGSDYVKYAERMIKKKIRVNNEFYVCPVFNEAIKDKKKIIISQVQEMHGLGTPEDLNAYLLSKN